MNFVKGTQDLNWKALLFPILIGVAVFFVGAVEAFAQTGSDVGGLGGIEDQIKDISVKMAYVAGAIIILLTVWALVTRGKTEGLKKFMFYTYTVAAVIPTLFFAGSTVYIDIISDSKGPVHWHTDYEIYACGERVVLEEPQGFLSNRVGTPDFHHHDDDRMHIEGTIVDFNDFEFNDFIHVIGGELTENSFTIPAAGGNRIVTNGDQCSSGARGEWQAFLYSVDPDNEREATERKLSPQELLSYVPAPYANVPPGDCLILEFDEPKLETDHLCLFWELAQEKGDLNIQQ